MLEEKDLANLATVIVASYVKGARVTFDEIGTLVKSAKNALVAAFGDPDLDQKERALTPAVPIQNSVTANYIVCLEDGKKFKSMKRHLRTQYNMSPEEYREKWGLPANYPMVAQSYSVERSKLAKQIGFGYRANGTNGAST